MTAQSEAPIAGANISICHCCRYRTVVGVHGGDRLGHSKLRERPFIIGRQPSSYI